MIAWRWIIVAFFAGGLFATLVMIPIINAFAEAVMKDLWR